MEMTHPTLVSSSIHKKDSIAPDNSRSGASSVSLLSSVMGEVSFSNVLR